MAHDITKLGDRALTGQLQASSRDYARLHDLASPTKEQKEEMAKLKAYLGDLKKEVEARAKKGEKRTNAQAHKEAAAEKKAAKEAAKKEEAEAAEAAAKAAAEQNPNGAPNGSEQGPNETKP